LHLRDLSYDGDRRHGTAIAALKDVQGAMGLNMARSGIEAIVEDVDATGTLSDQQNAGGFLLDGIPAGVAGFRRGC
jgi:hypothetical protein